MLNFIRLLFFSICVIFSLSFPSSVLAEPATPFEPGATYTVCFTPGEACTTEIVNAIKHAKKDIKVLAYSFTSKPIAIALIAAQKRGVNVEVIVDKTQSHQEKYSSATFLDHASIPVWIDYQPYIAHNKVMLIDGHVTITGSFNFTRAAQYKNAENIVIIDDQTLTQTFLSNWEKRKSASMSLSRYRMQQKTAAAGQEFEIIATSFLKALR